MSAYVARAAAMGRRYGAGRVYLATDDAAVVDEFRRSETGMQVCVCVCVRARARVCA